jgi:hypothetical protein
LSYWENLWFGGRNSLTRSMVCTLPIRDCNPPRLMEVEVEVNGLGPLKTKRSLPLVTTKPGFYVHGCPCSSMGIRESGLEKNQAILVFLHAFQTAQLNM